jgi:hypothetical protein
MPFERRTPVTAKVYIPIFVEENQMSKHLSNLERLSVKLQRYVGEDDALLQQVKRELALHQALYVFEPRKQDWSISYRKHLEHRRGVVALH